MCNFSVSLNASEIEKRIKKAKMIEVSGLVVDAGNLNALETQSFVMKKDY